jgi:hypothetical protein
MLALYSTALNYLRLAESVAGHHPIFCLAKLRNVRLLQVVAQLQMQRSPQPAHIHSYNHFWIRQ